VARLDAVKLVIAAKPLNVKQRDTGDRTMGKVEKETSKQIIE
jgi:hypothetical protein